MRVIKSGNGAGFALEARQALGIARHLRRQNLQRHSAPQLGVRGAIDLAHAARTDARENLITAEPIANCRLFRLSIALD